MYASQTWLFIVAIGGFGARAQTLRAELSELLTSFLANPTVIADFAQAERNPPLVSTLESYFQSLLHQGADDVPTAPPAFITALPSAAQDDMSRAFAQENSIISAAGGLSANSLVPVTETSSMLASNSSGPSFTVTESSQPETTSGSGGLTTPPLTDGASATAAVSSSSSSSTTVSTAGALRGIGASHIGMVGGILVGLIGHL